MQILNCNGGHGNAITHLNNRKKSKIHATWIAPEDAKTVQNGAKFVYTIVEEKSRFWANEQSPLLELKNHTNSVSTNFQICSSLLCFLIFSLILFK